MIWAFDIETGPLDFEEIERIAPEFEPENVKTGNISDLGKIAEKVEGARVAHFSSIQKGAALHAEYSSVLALGWTSDKTQEILHASDHTEPQMLSLFWDAAMKAYRDGYILAGHNIKNFDLPYMVRRSFKHGICVPEVLLPERSRFWPKFFFDTLEEWSMGDNQRRIGLNKLAKHLGLEGKSGTGKGFGKLFKEDQDAALAYLEQDLSVTLKVAEKLALTLGRGLR